MSVDAGNRPCLLSRGDDRVTIFDSNPTQIAHSKGPKMAGRPRLDAATNAQNRPGRSLGDAELVSSAPVFPPLPRRWREETRAALRTYAASATAKALRAEDVPAVMRLFGYQDELAQRWDALIEGNVEDEKDAISVIRTLESMVAALSTSLGIGPRARQSIGIRTETKPGSRLDAFRVGADEA